MSKPSAIYARYLEHCQACRLAGAWSGVVVDADCWACPTRGTAVLARLLEEFLEPDLVAAGVANPLPDGLVLNRTLVGATNSVIALRAAAAVAPFALLTSGGIVLSEGPPVPLAILGDFRTQDRLAKNGPRVLVAFTIEDVIVLRSQGLPATLAPDVPLDNLDQRCALERACHWGIAVVEDSGAEPGPGEAEPSVAGAEWAAADAQNMSLGQENVPPATDAKAVSSEPAGNTSLDQHGFAEEPIELALVAWSPFQMGLEESSDFVSYARALQDLERYLEMDISRIAVWRPTPEALRQLRYCLGAGAVDGAARTVAASAANSLFVLGTVSEQPDDESACYAVALHRMNQLLRRDVASHEAGELHEAKLAFEAAIEDELVGPLRAQVLADDDALRRSMGMLGVDLARYVHRHAPFVELMLNQPVDAGPEVGRASGGQPGLREILRVADRLVSVFRELRR